MATTRIMPLHIGKGRTESRAISDIIDYVANPQKTDNGKLITRSCCFKTMSGSAAGMRSMSISTTDTPARTSTAQASGG